MAGDSGWMPANLDPARPSPARIYDYALGGGHNLASDRALFEQVLKVQPNVRQMVWSNRSFMRRAVLFMIGSGIRQFLDLGSGIPTVGNVHEIAHKADPACCVVYVDIDEVAIAHSRLMLEHEENATVVEADLTRPADVLKHPETVRLLDFSRPIGLLAVASLHSVPAETDIYRPLNRYRDALAVGSALAISHFTADFEDVHARELIEVVQAGGHNRVCPRTRDEVLDLFGDFELTAPGLVPAAAWRPDTTPAPDGEPGDHGLWAGVAVKIHGDSQTTDSQPKES